MNPIHAIRSQSSGRVLRVLRRIDDLDPAHTDDLASLPSAFEPEDIQILTEAFKEACAFLGQGTAIGPARRHEVARVIIAHASRGARDAHHLALKAIVHVG